MEALGCTIKVVVVQGNIKGLRCYGNDLPISHHQSFGDIMLMGVPLVREARTLKKILEALVTFINEGKSQIYFFNTNFTVKGNLARLLRFQHSSLLTKYLGVPMVDNSLITIQCKELIQENIKKFGFLNLQISKFCWHINLVKISLISPVWRILTSKIGLKKMY